MGLKAKIDASLATRLPSLPAGILLGTTSPPRLLSYHATPPIPAGVAATRWASEHARLVLAMCPGGISVAARYIPTGPSTADAAAAVANAVGAPLVVCVATKGNLVAKELADNGSLRSADLRNVQALAKGVVPVRADVQVPSLAVNVEGNDRNAERVCVEKVIKLVSRAAVRLMDTKEGERVVVDITDDVSLGDVMDWSVIAGKGKKAVFETQEAINLELLLPIGTQDSDTGEMDGERVARVDGGLHVEAAVFQDASLGELLDAVHEDMERSLRIRVQLMIEDEAHMKPLHNDEEQVQGFRPMPVRIVARPQDGKSGLPMTEYLMDGETVEEDVMSRFVEVLSWSDEEIKSHQLLETELFATSGASETQKTAADPSEMTSLDVAASAPMTYAQHAVIAAFVMALLAILVKELL